MLLPSDYCPEEYFLTHLSSFSTGMNLSKLRQLSEAERFKAFQDDVPAKERPEFPLDFALAFATDRVAQMIQKKVLKVEKRGPPSGSSFWKKRYDCDLCETGTLLTLKILGLVLHLLRTE